MTLGTYDVGKRKFVCQYGTRSREPLRKQIGYERSGPLYALDGASAYASGAMLYARPSTRLIRYANHMFEF